MAASAELERKHTVKQRVGHLRVDEQGEITYKKTPSSTLMASLQLGLSHSIGSLEPKPRRDILMTDFDVIETVEFPSSGSEITQAHKNKDFTFTTYSPVAFRFFREEFQIKAEDYLLALCHQPLRELSNPGASGSLFYLSTDDEFIIKTVQKKEATFLQKLLPGYYLNLTQNKRTLLPKFFGLYQYRCGGIKIRIAVMNNLLPSSLTYHLKFDLKGSSYKRSASTVELQKKSPTFKDLDFVSQLPEGLIMSPESHDVLIATLQRDCKVLESFGIMDYSLLLGIYNIDKSLRSGEPPPTPTELQDAAAATIGGTTNTTTTTTAADDGSRGRAFSRIEARKNFSIISAETYIDTTQQEPPLLHYPEGYIQARNDQGDKLLLYIGVIDILQSYRLKKRLEHSLKAIITDGDTVSVHNPTFYSQRFLTFMRSTVFKKEKVKIRPRRNSSIQQPKGRRPTSNQLMPSAGGGSKLVLRQQESIELKDSPLHSSTHNTPHHRVSETTPTLEPTPPRLHEEAELQLSSVGVLVGDSDHALRFNSSTPVEEPDRSSAGMLIPENEQVVLSSVSISVNNNNRSDHVSRDDSALADNNDDSDLV